MLGTGSHYTVMEQNSPTSYLKIDRFSPIPGLIFTSIVCYTLLGLHVTNWRGSEGALNWTKTNRTYVTVIVQILSHALGLIQVQVICNVWRLSFIWSAALKPFRLYMAHFVLAASTPRMTWSLDWKLVSCLLMWNFAILLPAAGWSGAISPIQSEQSFMRPLRIPTYEFVTYNKSEISQSNMENGNTDISNTVAGGHPAWQTSQGRFTFNEAYTRKTFLDSASDASLVSVGYTEHAKLDKTGYSFVNRSNGVGALAGFTEFADTNPIAYNYTERALASNVTCFYNTSLNTYWAKIKTPSTILMQVFRVVEEQNDTMWGISEVKSWMADDLLTWRFLFNEPSGVTLRIVAAANGTSGVNDTYSYQDFNHIQCNIAWDLVDYSVKVNETSKLISNEPLNRGSLAWPDYGTTVAYRLFYHSIFAQQLDSYNYGGDLGNALRTNLNTLHNVTGIVSNESTLRSTEDFISRLMDQAHINVQTTRMVSGAPNATKVVTANVISPALVIGDFQFVAAISIFNALVCFLYLIECCRCRGWSGIPDLDLTNVVDVVASAFRGASIHRSETKDTTPSHGFDPSMEVYVKHGEGKAALIPLLAMDKHKSDIVVEPGATVCDDSQSEVASFHEKSQIYWSRQ